MGRSRRHSLAKEDLESIVVPEADGTWIHARVPRIERTFWSPMHRLEHHAIQYGPWRGALDAVLGHRMPLALLYPGEDEDAGDLRRRVIAAMEEGFPGGVTVSGDGALTGRVALPDAICDTVDVEALVADYTAWMAAAEILDRPEDDWDPDALTVREAVEIVLNVLEPGYGDYLWDVDRPPGLTGQIVRGLVLGHDPAATCAFALAGLLGDGRTFWRTGRRSPPP